MARKIVIPLEIGILGLGIGMVVGMHIIGWVFIGIAIALIPVAIWGDKWLMKFTNWLRARLNKEKAWLFNLESHQLADLGEYLFTEVHSIDYTHLLDIRSMRMEVEILNLTIFTLDITRVSFSVLCDGYPLGVEEHDPTPRRQVWGQRHRWWLEYPITDTGFFNRLKKAYPTRRKLSWHFDITCDLETALYGRKLSLKRSINIAEVPDLSQAEVDDL